MVCFANTTLKFTQQFNRIRSGLDGEVMRELFIRGGLVAKRVQGDNIHIPFFTLGVVETDGTKQIDWLSARVLQSALALAPSCVCATHKRG